MTQTKSDYKDLLAMFKTKKGNRELNTNVSAVFPSSMRDHITLLITDLHTRVLNLKNQLITLGSYGHEAPPTSLRVIRSPFDFVGTVASYLFGVTDK